LSGIASVAANLHHPCPARNLDYIRRMSKLVLLFLLAAALIVASGCKTHSGSREFMPGKGWVPND
jgi:hypothetical protein